MKVLIYASIVFVGLILVFLLRIFQLLYLKRGAGKKSIRKTGNGINAYLMLAFMFLFLCTFWFYSFQVSDQFLPEAATLHGEKLDKLFWEGTALILVPFTITHIVLFMFAFLYRQKKDKPAKYYPRNRKLEVTWTILTAGSLVTFIIVGLSLWNEVKSAPPKEAELIEIMGAQFTWQARYPGADGILGNSNYQLIDPENFFGIDAADKEAKDDFIPMTIHVPKGKPVYFIIRSRDVIHSLFIPHFRVKMDAVPGMPTRFWFTPKYTTEEMRSKVGDESFNYEIACAEVCGGAHFAMKALIVVDEPEDYKKWYSRQESWYSQYNQP